MNLKARVKFVSSFFLNHFPDDIAQRRTAPLAWPARARTFGLVLGSARYAGHLCGDRPRLVAQTARHDPRARRDRPAALRPLADGPFSKAGASLAQCPRPRQTGRPRQLRPLPVPLLAE